MTALLLIGCGKMGGAMLRRIAASRLVSRVVVVDPSPAPDDLKSLATWVASPREIDAAFAPDISIIAVKPQSIAEALSSYARFGGVFVSVAAGVRIEKLQALLGGKPVVRCMPNLPASIGKGASVAVASAGVSAAQRVLVEKFLGCVGTVAWVDNEALIDAVTALSGSGPAYVFALCEAMAKAGERLGLSAASASALARQTVIGAGALMAQSPDSAEALRRAVTSPGGTTAAALRVLAEPLDEIMLKAMSAAAKRAAELAEADN